MSSFMSSIATIAASRSTNLTNAQPFELPSGPRIIWTSRSSPYGANMLCKSSSSIVFGSMPMNNLFSLSAWLSAIRTWRGFMACKQINISQKVIIDRNLIIKHCTKLISRLTFGSFILSCSCSTALRADCCIQYVKKAQPGGMQIGVVSRQIAKILKCPKHQYLCEFDWSYLLLL